ncbi:hypothetical protein PROFUN_13079 [Planoprotostelium fungivorum]|uniref:Uncharacterized protein n=1 Tax=Planoprotostelium fungivorum TaxID=1890364 RepID=A0A2P6N5G9_9EUKA|nr:hypothetical protein PROFUN_13079 [Planoprotostelium fungivorum]
MKIFVSFRACLPSRGLSEVPAVYRGSVLLVAVAASLVGVYIYSQRKRKTVPSFQSVLPKGIKTYEQAEHHASRFLKDLSADYPVIGFDVEWKPHTRLNRSPAALIQMSNERECFLFHIIRFRDDGLPPSLIQVLEDPNIIKAGVGILQDARMILTDYQVNVNSTVELSCVSQRYHETEGGTSLAYLSKSILNLTLDKKGARCSDWERHDLTSQQIDYAAADAWVAHEIFSKLHRRAMKQNREPITVEDFSREFIDRNPVKVFHPKETKGGEKGEKGKLRTRKEYPSRRDALYENCKMVSLTGEVLCTCSLKKLKWYIERGLADQISDDPPTIRLKFQPNGQGHSGDPYYLGEKKNICVVCGTEAKLVRHSIVPHSYRRHFDVKDKSRSSHDIVLVCQKCLQKISVLDTNMRQRIARETGVPLGGVGEKWLVSRELQRAKKFAKVFACGNQSLPAEKEQEYKEVVAQYLGKSAEELTEEDYERVIAEEKKCMNPEYRAHDEVVIEMMKDDRDELERFVHSWRRHFVNGMKPKHLPSHWSVDRPLDARQLWSMAGGNPDHLNSTETNICVLKGVNCSSSSVNPTNAEVYISFKITWDRLNFPGVLNGTTLNQMIGLNGFSAASCGLSGGIMSTLFGTSNLTSIDLHNNSLVGPVPLFDPNDKLTALDLSQNVLSGDLQFLYGLKQLITLNVSNNRFSGNVIGNFPNAISIDQSHNQLTGNITSQLGGADLRVLLLNSNAFTTLTDLPPQFNTSANASLTCNLSNNPSISSMSYRICFPLPPPLPPPPLPRPSFQTNISNLSVSDAERVLSKSNVTSSQLLPLLNIITAGVLTNGTRSFSLRSGNISVTVETFSPTERGVVQLTEGVGASVPAKILDRNVTLAVSYVPFNPYQTNITYGGVVGVTLFDVDIEIDVDNLSQLINITMGTVPNLPADHRPNCLHWNETEMSWKTGGCIADVQNGLVTCRCSHLTNFTLGSEQIPPPRSSSSDHKIIIMIVCCAVGGLLVITAFVVLYRHHIRRRTSSGYLQEMQNAYELKFEEKLYEGSWCQVWSGVYAETTNVAIKKCTDKECRQRLEREANLLKFLGEDMRRDEPHFFTGFVPNVYTGCNMPDADLLVVAHQVAGALVYLSGMNLVHTHLVPKKVLFTRDDTITVKLCGFADCVSHDSAPAIDGLGITHIGLHTAPEVIQSGGIQTLPADVYSFGVLLWTMGSNRMDPLADLSKENVKRTILAGNVGLEGKVGWHPVLMDLFKRCTSTTAEDRPDMRQVSKELSMAANPSSQLPFTVRADNIYVEE